ncbi:SDR family NAD(P)-dependent oxidoreductase [Stappia sp. GBMRC 2046]|uniref:SDR family NAD(P)-dependent oxidoreductase n=1 Tax=Stappia sediminis TaxID=2692190 RepID=A0A7X3S6Y2_9HYPH|nr:SDR family NAD(P)-dependent oxidoreductase [Stappia sediminis]MXN64292.1 SDR family NAD(P)-dependent oxidoreductase [Stappia sediminis]
MSSYIASPEDGVAWITGASSGIGRALAMRLAREGWKVAVTARSQDALEAMAGDTAALPGSIMAFPGDVTDAKEMENVVEAVERALGPLVLAVLNAGVYLPVKGDDLTVRDFEKSIAVNLVGTVNCIVPLSRWMKESGKGQIAIVSSVAGYRGLPTSAAYGATKAGLINMAESLKFDFDRMGIRLQVIAPGFVETPATAQNPFPMPYLLSVEEAAERIAGGLKTRAFEITFPRRFSYQLKLLRMLPYRLYFAIVAKATGWSKKK